MDNNFANLESVNLAGALAASKKMPQLNFNRVKGGSPEEIKAVSKEFSAVFVAEMFRVMFETVEINPEFGGGVAEDTYRSMLIDEYGKVIAEKGSVGIADSVTRQIMKLQEVK